MTVSLMMLRGRTRNQLGVPQTDQLFTDQIIDDFLNMAVDIIDAEHNWPWRESTVKLAATDGVLWMPTNWRATRTLWWKDVQLVNISPSDPRMSYELGSGSAPVYWAQIDARVHVVPATAGDTDEDFTLDYYDEGVPMSRDEDALGMPDMFAGAAIAKACELLSLREDNAGAAERHAASYAQWLGRMRRSLRRSTGPIVPRIREGGWIG